MASSLINSVRTIEAWIKKAAALQRLSDGEGLYLLKPKVGAPGWRLDYSSGGKRNTLGLGTYPATGLAEARDKARDTRALLVSGQDPSAARKAKRVQDREQVAAAKRHKLGLAVAGTFEEVARRWYADRKNEWAESYQPKIIRRLEMYAFPQIGTLAMSELAPPAIVQMCRLVQNTGSVETAHRVLKLCSQVSNYAIAEGTLRTANPCIGVRGALKTPVTRHFPAITQSQELAPLLRAIYGYHGSFVVLCALKLAPILMVRPGELRQARWEHFDLDHGLWRLPAEALKATRAQGQEDAQKDDHLVPLPRQAVEILEQLFELTGSTGAVFPGVGRKGRYMSDGTVNAALRALGYPQNVITGHGFRATARTILVEILEFGEHIAEMQLAHAVKDLNGRAYNRAQFIEQRIGMMQAWADYLEGLRVGASVKQHPVLPSFRPVTARLQQAAA